MAVGSERALTAVGAGLVGLMIGSFLNVVVYRVPRHRSVVRPGSACPSCGSTLSGWENVPLLSWLVLRGHCRHCNAPISGRYPLVEAVTGGAFAALGGSIGWHAPLAPLLVVAAAAIAAAAIDFDGFAVPRPVLAAALLGSVGLAALSLARHEPRHLWWPLCTVGAVSVLAVVGSLGTGPLGGGAVGPDASPTRRDAASRMPGRLAALAAVAWCAGWVWAPGGLAVAGVALCWVIGGGAVESQMDAARATGLRRWGFTLGLAGATCLLLAGAALRG
ncbi:MAG TPA: prepilin peptidase [Acidimicrobiales bacterium]